MHAIIPMNLKNSMLSERRQTQKTKVHIYSDAICMK